MHDACSPCSFYLQWAMIGAILTVQLVYRPAGYNLVNFFHLLAVGLARRVLCDAIDVRRDKKSTPSRICARSNK